MVKARNFQGLRRGGIGMLRSIVEKLQTGLPGRFVVIATKGWQPKRFVVKLGCLNHPEFLKLLKQSEEEFGFCQEGALAIPCRPDELQKILTVIANVKHSCYKAT